MIPTTPRGAVGRDSRTTPKLVAQPFASTHSTLHNIREEEGHLRRIVERSRLIFPKSARSASENWCTTGGPISGKPSSSVRGDAVRGACDRGGRERTRPCNGIGEQTHSSSSTIAVDTLRWTSALPGSVPRRMNHPSGGSEGPAPPQCNSVGDINRRRRVPPNAGSERPSSPAGYVCEHKPRLVASV